MKHSRPSSRQLGSRTTHRSVCAAVAYAGKGSLPHPAWDEYAIWKAFRGAVGSCLLLCNALSLDAVVVASAWQALFAMVFEAPMSLGERTVLPLMVWLIYAGDRLLDDSRFGVEGCCIYRRSFARKWRTPMVCAWVCACALVGAVIAFSMRSSEILMCGAFALSVLLYLAVCHVRPFAMRTLVPRELVVGWVFAGSTVVLLLDEASGVLGPLGVGTSLFGCLCFLNCWLISCAERDADVASGEASLATEYPGLSRAFVPLCGLFSGAVLLAAWACPALLSTGIALALVGSVLGLVAVRLGGAPLRYVPVLADVSLAVPALGVLLWR